MNCQCQCHHRPREGEAAANDNFDCDLLRGAAHIALFLFGDTNCRRKVYHLVETSRLPVFRLGSTLCARRSVLLRWVADQEGRNWK